MDDKVEKQKREVESLLKEDISSREKNFLNSLNQQLTYRELSQKQVAYLNKIAANYSAEAKKEQLAWEKKFSSDPTFQKNWSLVVFYYSRTRYWQSILHKTVINKEYIPTCKEYKTLCENRYSQKILKAYWSKPKFSTGTLVILNSQFDIRRSGAVIFDNKTSHKDIQFLKPGSVAMVIKNDHEVVYSAASGSKLYTLMPLGSAKAFVTEERFLKKGPKTK